MTDDAKKEGNLSEECHLTIIPDLAWAGCCCPGGGTVHVDFATSDVPAICVCISNPNSTGTGCSLGDLTYVPVPVNSWEAGCTYVYMYMYMTRST